MPSYSPWLPRVLTLIILGVAVAVVGAFAVIATPGLWPWFFTWLVVVSAVGVAFMVKSDKLFRLPVLSLTVGMALLFLMMPVVLGLANLVNYVQFSSVLAIIAPTLVASLVSWLLLVLLLLQDKMAAALNAPAARTALVVGLLLVDFLTAIIMDYWRRANR